MWKKDDMPEPTPYARPEPAPPAPIRPAPVVEAPMSNQRATIGSSITIRGDVTGVEDLLIQGRVDGSVDLKQHAVTIGKEGEVKANVSGRVIAVEGKVEGNLLADEQVILRASAIVQGDIVSPRVVLEDGARFRGGIDMGESMAPIGAQRSAGKGAQSSRPAPAPIEVTPRAPESSAPKGDGAGRKTAEVTP